jgi:hypothetical protein
MNLLYSGDYETVITEIQIKTVTLPKKGMAVDEARLIALLGFLAIVGMWLF